MLRMSPYWIWWSTLILLLLRLGNTPVFADDETTTEISESKSTEAAKDGPKNADELGVPKCSTNYQCVNNGVCVKDATGHGRCLCPRSCTSLIPMYCKHNRNSDQPCLVMGENYSRRFDINNPTCHKARCVCPPMFDAVNLTKYPIKTLLPVKCDKRELQVLGAALPSNSVYKGTDVKLYCCLNIDPTNHIDASGVTFIQNETVTREPTKHPFKEQLSEYDQLIIPSCWELEIRNVQQSDSGSYMCLVTPSGGYGTVNYTIDLQVKAPRMIQNLSIAVNETASNVTWQIQDGPQLKIDLRLVRRTDLHGKEVWSRENAVSPLSIGSLRPATPYTLFVTVRDGQMEPFQLSEHFTTSDAKPLPPKFVGVRVGYNSGPSSAGASLNCEVEWSSPAITNGRIVKYYVRVRGQLRRPRPDGTLVADDFPPALDKKCANWDEEEQPVNGINPIEFSSELLFCKYGPLKPNRNYSVTVWAENAAGRSSPILFPKSCLTHYAQPDQVEKPATSAGTNHTSFTLTFNSKPDDTNGPISCSYIAVVPLPGNVSLDTLPSPQDIVMDTSIKAMANNMQPPSDKKVYMAYIAESYADLPSNTVIGDGKTVDGLKPCNVMYLSRHRAGDAALRAGMKYTGFLIVRVDKEKDEVDGGASSAPPPPTYRRKIPPTRHMRDYARGGRDTDSREGLSSRMMDSVGGRRSSSARSLRQLHLSGPVYGFSGYFKPVFLRDDTDGGVFATAFKIVIPIMLFIVMATVITLVILQRRGTIRTWWPLKLNKDSADMTILRPTFTPTPIEDLPSEYLIRHRDSDFLFTQEFENLPKDALDATASNRKENASKNRYNDIRAFDATRVKLKRINGVDSSDYINANYINGWDGRKKFIATQAPLDHTVDDFWRMIWEQNSRMVIMVTNLHERSRQQCSKYWPDEAPERYGNLLVTPIPATYNAFYTIREFDISECSSRLSPSRSDFGGSVESNVGSEYANVPPTRSNGRVETSFGGADVRRIVQYHFTNWNDYRAPECSTGLLRFLHRLRPLHDFNHYPVVIHCSAGVGRTGTFIAIDSMLDQCLAEKRVDIFGYVSKLRLQRNMMVQSPEQYIFVYKALAEWHLFGDTDLSVTELQEHYQELMDPNMRDRSCSVSGATRLVIRPDSTAPINGMEAEFRKLDQTLETPNKISFAYNDENIMKNRFKAAVPYDKNRIVLSAMLGFTDSTYTNASEIKGYFYPYILAQDPVSNATVFDFWRMICEKSVSTVVMLSQEEDWSASEKYWPDEVHHRTVFEKKPHQFHVTLESMDVYPSYIVRRMTYTNPSVQNTDETPREVTMFSMLGWPSDAPVPPSVESLITLIGRVLERQSKSDSGPIVLHCRNGSSQTGVFCCVSLLLERLKAEQRVDIFQTVKGLQTQRPMLFTTLAEYQFCYRAVIDYIRFTTGLPPSGDC